MSLRQQIDFLTKKLDVHRYMAFVDNVSFSGTRHRKSSSAAHRSDLSNGSSDNKRLF